MKAYRITIESIDNDGATISSISTVAPSTEDRNDDAMRVAKSLGCLLRGFSAVDYHELLESCNEDMLLFAAAVHAYGWRERNTSPEDPDSRAFDAAVGALNAQLPASMRSYDGTNFKP